MHNHELLETAFQFARSGTAKTVQDVRRHLVGLGYSQRELQQLSGVSLSGQLSRLVRGSVKSEVAGGAPRFILPQPQFNKFPRPMWRMDSELTKALHYRDQARQMREMAAKENNFEARDAVTGLAEMYDRLYRACLDRAGGRRSLG